MARGDPRRGGALGAGGTGGAGTLTVLNAAHISVTGTRVLTLNHE